MNELASKWSLIIKVTEKYINIDENKWWLMYPRYRRILSFYHLCKANGDCNWQMTTWIMWPPHSISTLGWSTGRNWILFKSRSPQNKTSNLWNIAIIIITKYQNACSPILNKTRSDMRRYRQYWTKIQWHHIFGIWKFW